MHILPLAHGETPGGTTSFTPSPSTSWTRQPWGSEKTRPKAAYSASLVATGLGIDFTTWLNGVRAMVKTKARPTDKRRLRRIPELSLSPTVTSNTTIRGAIRDF